MTDSDRSLHEQKRRQVVERARTDRHAPLFHFIPPEGNCRCFDPNGAIFWNGRYHLFYIFQDPALRTGDEFYQLGHCWGHASSTDLVHWTHHPTALAPDSAGPEVAIYSGCALVSKAGVPIIVYHGYGAGTCIAMAQDDDLSVWSKHSGNPVIPEPKQEGDAGWGVYNVFDPHVWREGDGYYAILGGKVKPHDIRDTAYIFKSPDLIHWEYLHPLYDPNPKWTGEGDDCACPDFFEIGGRHMLLCISHALGARYYLGEYRNEKFIPSEHHRMNWPGGCCFAPESLLDDTNRRIMWAWALDQRQDRWGDGALGVLTMPRVLTMVDDALRIELPAEFESVRRNHRRMEDIAIPADAELRLLEISGDCLEIIVEVETAARFGLKLRLSPDGAEQTAVIYDVAACELCIDMSQSSLTPGWRPHPLDFWRGIPVEDIAVQRAELRRDSGEPLRLRVFLDRSILEVFANNGLCMTARIYPDRSDSTGVALFTEGGAAQVRRCEAWNMQTVNAE